jgi:hypothetical protein
MSPSPAGQRTMRDPQPLSRGGEVAFVVLAGIVLLIVGAALAGLGVAAALFGGGWVWPHGTATIGHVLSGLMTGDPGQGLPASLQPRVPSRLAVYSCVATLELLILIAAGASTVLFWRHLRPAGRGMATRAEAEQVLGVSRLRQARYQIRPDLTGHHERVTVSNRHGDGTAGDWR